MFFEPEGHGTGLGDPRYRQIVEQLDMPLVVHVDGIIVFATQATADLVGAAHLDELRGRPLVDFIHPEDLDLVVEQMMSVLSGEPSARQRYRVRRTDGATRWVEAAATPYLLDGKRTALVVVEDVTARLEVEEQLRASEERHRALVHKSGDIVTILTEQGTVAYVSPATEAVLGRSPAELVGTDVDTWLHPEDFRLLQARLDGIGDVADGHSMTATLRLRHRDGSWRHLEVVATAQLRNEAIRGIVVNARDVTDRIAAEGRLRRLALRDPLTGLANRVLLEERIRQAVDRGTAAVVMLDLDRFKDINDSLGHAIGDVVLVEVADRIRRAVRSGDTVGRVGGDEFVLVLPDGGDVGEVSVTVQRILDAIQRPVDHGTNRFRLTASVGVAFAPAHGTDSDGLLRAADAAMYRAKRERSGLAVFDHHDRDRSARRLTMTNELIEALEQGQFELHYQPKYDLLTGRLIGVEALLRWNHPTKGTVTPDDFLPLAEDTGLIHGITTWVVDTAIGQAARWAEAGRDLTVAVNLSPSSLQDTSFVHQVEAALDRHGLDGDRLVLEVTEQIVMADPEAALDVMRRLTAVGVSFSVDDFGTGYSSLTYLRLLPVEELKIDRSFIGDVHGQVDEDIVETIIALSRRLGLRVVAEGIETAVAAAYLRAVGCDVGQGYHLGAPVPAAQLPAVPAGAAAVPTGPDLSVA